MYPALYERDKNLNSIKDPALKVLMILKRVSAIYEKQIEPYYSEFLMNKDLDANYGENRMSIHKSLAKAITAKFFSDWLFILFNHSTSSIAFFSIQPASIWTDETRLNFW